MGPSALGEDTPWVRGLGTVFTGIVEAVGKVARAEHGPGATRLLIEAGDLSARLGIGESLAVNGVCLTVRDRAAAGVWVDVIPETLARTNLGRLRGGDLVNLERSLPADGRFGGHMVLGHVDATGTVAARVEEGDGIRLTVSFPASLGALIAEKGSVAVEGVSLTVAEVTDAAFSVALVPHTLNATNLGLRGVGEAVNLEVDVLARYLQRLLESSA